jgi:chromate transport protein ChrA
MIKKRVSFLSLTTSFFYLGATIFGGMYAGMNRLEREIVLRRNWLTAQDISVAIIVATFVPAPQFLALGAVIGFRLRGWFGAVVASVSLVAPASLLILGAVVALPPELLSGQLAPLKRVVAVAVVGIIFGNACRLLKMAQERGGFIAVSGMRLPAGHLLALALVATLVLGAPIIPAVLVSVLVSYVIGGVSSEVGQ